MFVSVIINSDVVSGSFSINLEYFCFHELPASSIMMLIACRLAVILDILAKAAHGTMPWDFNLNVLYDGFVVSSCEVSSDCVCRGNW